MRTLDILITDERTRVRIKERRKTTENPITHKKYTQEQLARKCKVSKEVIKHIENKKGVKSMSSDVLRRICDALKCTEDYILCKTDDPEISKLKPDTKKVFPTDNIADWQIDCIVEYMQKDELTRQNLFFLITKIPYEHMETLISSFNSLVTLLRDYSFLEYADKGAFSSSNLERIKEILIGRDEYIMDMIMIYSDAKELMNRRQYKEALYLFMKFLCEGIVDFRLDTQLFEWTINNVGKITRVWPDYKKTYRAYYEPIIKLAEKALQNGRDVFFSGQVHTAWKKIKNNSDIKPKRQQDKTKGLGEDVTQDTVITTDNRRGIIIEMIRELFCELKELERIAPPTNEIVKKEIKKFEKDMREQGISCGEE